MQYLQDWEFAGRFSRRRIEKAMEVVRALKNTLSRA